MKAGVVGDNGQVRQRQGIRRHGWHGWCNCHCRGWHWRWRCRRHLYRYRLLGCLHFDRNWRGRYRCDRCRGRLCHFGWRRQGYSRSRRLRRHLVAIASAAALSRTTVGDCKIALTSVRCFDVCGRVNRSRSVCIHACVIAAFWAISSFSTLTTALATITTIAVTAATLAALAVLSGNIGHACFCFSRGIGHCCHGHVR